LLINFGGNLLNDNIERLVNGLNEKISFNLCALGELGAKSLSILTQLSWK